MFTCGLLRSNFSLLIFLSSSLKERGHPCPHSYPLATASGSVTLEPAMRFELMTSSLPRRRSTPELRGLSGKLLTCQSLKISKRQVSNLSHCKWSGRRDSNSRPSAWKADALPTELHPPNSEISNLRSEIP